MLAKIVFMLVCLTPTAAQARENAPLPVDFKDETERGGFDVYDKFPATLGVYAHGVSGGLVLDDVDPLKEFCAGSDAERKAVLSKYASTNKTEYWHYGTSAQGVLFIKSTSLLINPDTLRKCSDLVLTRYEIHRAYVADGFIHNFVFADHTAPGLGSNRQTTSTREYSGSFGQLQSFMARPPLPTRRKGRVWARDKLAGEPVICDGTSGIVWSLTCYAARKSIRGMILRADAGDDERTMFENHVLEVDPDILLPGVVFEVDREWRPRDEQ